MFGQSGDNTFRVKMSNCFENQNTVFERKLTLKLMQDYQTVVLGLNGNVTASVVSITMFFKTFNIF